MHAERIAISLGGRRAGAGWMARCPAHDDRSPSLSLRDAGADRVLVYCHAGCDQRRVIAALSSLGLWTEPHPSPRVSSVPRGWRHHDRDQATRSTAALALWQSATAAAGTLVSRYLSSRGWDRLPPATVRFAPALKHAAGGLWPAMVSLVTRGCDDVPLAVHRTYLARDGARKAPVEPSKMMLGPCRGGAVRLATASRLLRVGEGIETCLAAMRATGDPAWAALSTAGLKALDLPSHVQDVIILADGDAAGEAAARHAAGRWARQGRRVRIARPPDGLDFNDLLLRGVDPAGRRTA